MYAHVGLKNRTQLHTSIRHIDKKKVNFRQEFFSLSVPNQQGESKRPNQPVFQDFSLYGLLSPLGRVSILGPTSIYTLYSQTSWPSYTVDYFLFAKKLLKNGFSSKYIIGNETNKKTSVQLGLVIVEVQLCSEISNIGVLLLEPNT